jgi:hypothetical protein
MSVTAGLRGTITLTDNLTGSTSLTKTVNNSYTGDLSVYGQSVVIGTTAYSVGLPNNLAEFVYVKNLSTVTGTNVFSFLPGGMIIFSELTTNNGISSLSLISNQAGTFVEFILAG